MSAVLITVPTATQNSPFLPQWWPKLSSALIAPTRGGMARLSGLGNPEWQTGQMWSPIPVLTELDAAIAVATEFAYNQNKLYVLTMIDRYFKFRQPSGVHLKIFFQSCQKFCMHYTVSFACLTTRTETALRSLSAHRESDCIGEELAI